MLLLKDEQIHIMQASILKHIIQPCDGNMIVYSRLSDVEFEKKSAEGIGIKLGFTGSENYLVDNKEFLLQADEYLLVNHKQNFATQVEKNEARGLCIQVNNKTLNDIKQSLLIKPDKIYFYDEAQSSEPLYFTNKINKTSYNNTGRFLSALKNYNYELNIPQLPEDFFYGLAYHLVTEHLNVQIPIDKLSAKKTGTKKELYSRIKKAKEIMDDCYLQRVHIDSIAKEINLSKFYFLQTYKAIYGISPYQYLIFRRLGYAKHLLGFSTYTINEIAILSGYSDIHSFSKSFKKAFNIAPSSFR